MPVGDIAGFHQMLDEDRARRVRGEPSEYMKMCSLDPNEPHLFPGEATYNFIHQYVDADPDCTWVDILGVRVLSFDSVTTF